MGGVYRWRAGTFFTGFSPSGIHFARIGTIYTRPSGECPKTPRLDPAGLDRSYTTLAYGARCAIVVLAGARAPAAIAGRDPGPRVRDYRERRQRQG